MTLDQITAVVNTGGVVFVLVAALFGLYREWWYPRSYVQSMRTEMDELRKDRDFWREIGHRGVGTAEQAVKIAARKP